mgnify:CR=1 FL=1
MNLSKQPKERFDARKRHGLLCDPKEHRATQEAKEQCDINRVLDRARHGASLSHVMQHGGRYGDFSDLHGDSYNDMLNRLADASSIFNDLPAELRSEFDNDPGKFFEFVGDKTEEELIEALPALSAPGRQFPDVVGNTVAAAAKELVEAVKAVSDPADPDSGDKPSGDDPGAGDAE